jgi:hypothetical protein
MSGYNLQRRGTARTLPKFLCFSIYCLFCVVLCIVCVCMCTVLLPPGGYPIAIKHTTYHIVVVSRKTNLMHNLFLVYFVNLYMFRTYLDPSSGGTAVCIQQLVFIILFIWLSVVLVGMEVPIQVILSIFRQSLHVSGVSRSIIRRYNRI